MRGRVLIIIITAFIICLSFQAVMGNYGETFSFNVCAAQKAAC